MSRILIDLTDEQVEALSKLAEVERRPRAAVIRDAIGVYVAQRKLESASEVFGLWKKGRIDGLAYQQKLRSEW